MPACWEISPPGNARTAPPEHSRIAAAAPRCTPWVPSAATLTPHLSLGCHHRWDHWLTQSQKPGSPQRRGRSGGAGDVGGGRILHPPCPVPEQRGRCEKGPWVLLGTVSRARRWLLGAEHLRPWGGESPGLSRTPSSHRSPPVGSHGSPRLPVPTHHSWGTMGL